MKKPRTIIKYLLSMPVQRGSFARGIQRGGETLLLGKGCPLMAPMLPQFLWDCQRIRISVSVCLTIYT